MRFVVLINSSVVLADVLIIVFIYF